jgi:hypothetical protein
MIPEPAAFVTYAIAEAANNVESSQLIEKPVPFRYRPCDITEANIGNLTLSYQATDVLPPPEDYVTVSDQNKFGGGDSTVNYDHGALLSIPTGYEAIWGTVSALWNNWAGEVNIDVHIGSETHRFKDDGDWAWGTHLTNRYSGTDIATGGTIPWAFNTFNIPSGVVSVEVLCRVTERRKQQWQAETHAKLITAYKQRMQEYDEKIARQKLQEGISIQGT